MYTNVICRLYDTIVLEDAHESPRITEIIVLGTRDIDVDCGHSTRVHPQNRNVIINFVIIIINVRKKARKQLSEDKDVICLFICQRDMQAWASLTLSLLYKYVILSMHILLI